MTSPAVRADGLINVELADEQLGFAIDPVMSAAKGTRPIESSPAAPVEVYVGPGRPKKDAVLVLTPAQTAQAQLIRARADDASIKAERSRRELNAMSGVYTMTEEMRREYGRGIMEHLTTVEQSLPDLAQRLGIGRDGLLELRRWWRQQRENTAERNRIEAAHYPEFVADTMVQ